MVFNFTGKEGLSVILFAKFGSTNKIVIIIVERQAFAVFIQKYRCSFSQNLSLLVVCKYAISINDLAYFF